MRNRRCVVVVEEGGGEEEEKEEEEGGGFFLVYVIGLNDPRPRLDENRRVRQCVWRERERGGREGENKAVEQLDRHLLGVYARL